MTNEPRKEPAKKPTTYAPALSDLVIPFLRKRADQAEPLALLSQGEESLALGIGLLFDSGTDPQAPLDEVLKLASVLRIEKRSPTAADAIIATLSRDPRVVEFLRGQSGAAVEEF